MSNTKTTDHRVQSYLKPFHAAIITRVVQVEEISESKALKLIIKEWFDKLPPERKEKYNFLQLSKSGS